MKSPRRAFWLLLVAWGLPARALPAVAAEEAAPPGAALGLLQAAAGMLLVLGLIFLCAWLARRFGLQRRGASGLVKIVSSAPVGTRERVVVVEVAGTWLVLGVTASQVNTLHSLPVQPAAGGGYPSAEDPGRRMMALFSSKLREAAGANGSGR